MKEKRIVLSVVLGVSFVFLILSLISALVDSLTMLTDFTKLNGDTDEPYYIIYGVLQLIAVLAGLAFAVVPMLKKTDVKLTVIFSACLVIYSIIALIVLKVTLPVTEYGEGYYTKYYAMYTSYLGFFVVTAVTAVLVAVSSILLKKQRSQGSEDVAQGVDKSEQTDTDIINI